MQNYFVRPASNSAPEKAISGTSELDAACRYLLDNPVRENLSVRSASGSLVEVKIADVLTAFPDMEKLLGPAPVASAPLKLAVRPPAEPVPVPSAAAMPAASAATITPDSVEDEGVDYSKLGGWLWVLLIALTVSTIYSIISVKEALDQIKGMDMETLKTLRPDLVLFIHVEIASDVTLAILSAISVVLLLLKKKLARYLIILFLSLNIASVVVTFAWGGSLSLDFDADTISQWVKGAVISAIWLAYMIFSKRAKYTLVR
ncbi:MAG TPA: DUF2569 family protein [Opitutales bacterium]|nr:DUF2569 family protein [Opitutales bacterium]